MQRTRIKICGITRVEDALAAVAAGADAIGLVFYPPSPRAVDIAMAREIAAALPPFVSSVGLFVNESREGIEEVLASVPLSLLQFHGEEAAEYCQSFQQPYIKAVRMHEGVDLDRLATDYAGAQGLLLDAYVKGVKGGTGEAFDWERVPKDFTKPIILAGGLRPDNVAAAITVAQPYAVDVSGGVEVEPGVKSAEKIQQFVEQVIKQEKKCLKGT